MKKERLDKERCQWILKRMKERKEFEYEWAERVGISYFMMCKVLHQVKSLPKKYSVNWEKMEKILEGDAPYEGL